MMTKQTLGPLDGLAAPALLAMLCLGGSEARQAPAAEPIRGWPGQS
jgi:hypothetical protein